MLIDPEVAEALAAGRAVVALESTIITHGLPRPDNLRVAREIENAVRSGGAVPATIAMVGGEPHIGLDDEALYRIATSGTAVKVSVRELAMLAAAGGDGATTVAATAHLAAAAGITVFATGGLGGVHRGARENWDESADLTALSRTPVLVVCSGVKSILDIGATLERLETLGVGVIGYRTDRFPAFYLADSGHRIDWQVGDPEQVAAVLHARSRLGTEGYGLVLANPIAREAELDCALHDRVLAEGLAAAEAQGVRGKDVTPFLLEHFHQATQGASVDANVALVLANARLAGQVAVAYAGR
ncbi:pseudouridine-5'-phosphate glycosidase [Mycolicibacter hiberniae]|uniref:Pseudouridine-5'-phosphate glycosidase n=1 Tax=Mycolicibacter hiberniae TaxID=29314 RepID=A0A7I7WYN9_9MYCO|nr:pseudouridine-5'-phosphate glycosidase [Mycolicibacter hiberniae]MCV7086683.1 pseudouridine-5'-phosphate glycosidase [Mycolicibacter hiberniae]ORV67023.1 pseudouridine-5-phosphate glycosidase [Mycolicibacter hiberniae]BBZ22270.1 pseudouridine-5'-phosphate glycosidase [Mycolicibacter hiberniae]